MVAPLTAVSGTSSNEKVTIGRSRLISIVRCGRARAMPLAMRSARLKLDMGHLQHRLGHPYQRRAALHAQPEHADQDGEPHRPRVGEKEALETRRKDTVEPDAEEQPGQRRVVAADLGTAEIAHRTDHQPQYDEREARQ